MDATIEIAEPDVDHVMAILNEHEMEGERLANKVRLGLVVVSLASLGGIWNSNTLGTNIILLVQLGVWLAFALVHRFLLANTKQFRPGLKYLSVTVDLIIVGATYAATVANYPGPLEYWAGGGPILFAFWNLMSGVRYSVRVSIYSTVLTVALNIGFAIHTIWMDGLNVYTESGYGTFSIDVADMQMFVVFAGAPGIVAAILASRSRALVTRAEVEIRRRTTLERERDSLGRYLPRELVDSVLAEPDRMKLGGARQEATILFIDIRGFTPLAERLDPTILVDLLNTFFQRMVPIVFRYGGTLDKYTGDGFMTVFGAPFSYADEPALAVLAAIDMARAAKELAAELRAAGRPPLAVGLGIATGMVVAGNIGSDERMDYTCVGEAVNIASRLEGMNKVLGTTILISENTFDALHGTIAADRLSPIRITGIEAPIQAFSIDPMAIEEAELEELRTRILTPDSAGPLAAAAAA